MSAKRRRALYRAALITFSIVIVVALVLPTVLPPQGPP